MALRQHLPGKSENAEDDGKDKEATDLDSFAAEFVDGEDGEPVPGERAGAVRIQLNAWRFKWIPLTR